jgi:hypothetical protein
MIHETTPQSTGYLLCDDLLWISRVMGEAKALDCKILPARTTRQLLELVHTHGPHSVLLDLSHPEIGQHPESIVHQLRERGVNRVVAYGPHVETPLLKSARQAGCDPVWPRSKMAEELPGMLPAWLKQ